MTPADVLRKAADKISEPNAWTRHELARDENGDAVSPSNKRAVCWCALGAIFKVSVRIKGIERGDVRAVAQVALRRALPAEHSYAPYGADAITQFNDVFSSGVSDVAAAMRAAADSLSF